VSEYPEFVLQLDCLLLSQTEHVVRLLDRLRYTRLRGNLFLWVFVREPLNGLF
jgi:hypothetical protein